MRAIPRLQSLDALSDPDALRALLGPIARVEAVPLESPGYSGSRHTRLIATLEGGGTRALVLKRTRLSANWVARFSDDRLGREEAWLHEPAFEAVRKAFDLPHLATAKAPDEHTLLMEDLTPALFPDVREPLPQDAEEALLDALATLHATFWESRALAHPMLATFKSFLDLLGPHRPRDEAGMALLPGPMAERVADGWNDALRRLPRAAADALAHPASELVRSFGPLPDTLVHGDVKVANFARAPGGRLAAFDWALIGRAPNSVDLGWYVAVNATRLSSPKTEALARYRERLEIRLGCALEGSLWSRLREAAIVSGARMLLWSKAWALRAGGDREREEWSWWAEELERWARGTGGW